MRTVPKALVVEDDIAFYEGRLRPIFDACGCSTVLATTPARAKELLKTEIFHFVTVDIHLKDEANGVVHDGLDVVAFLIRKNWQSHITCMVISELAGVQEFIKQVYRFQPLHHEYQTGVLLNNIWYFDKIALDVPAFQSIVTTSIEKRNLQLPLSTVNDNDLGKVATKLADDLDRAARKGDPDAYKWFLELPADQKQQRLKQEVHALLCQVFVGMESIEPLPIGQGLSSTTVLKVEPVLDGRPLAPALVKMGITEQIDREMNNYARYVRSHIGIRPTLQSSGDTILLKAILYDWLHDYQSFADFYHGNDGTAIQKVLATLFAGCKRWYFTSPLKTIDYVAAYSEFLPFAQVDLSENLTYLKPFTMTRDTIQVATRLGTTQLLNPVKVLSRLTAAQKPYRTIAGIITHGDLHENNIMVQWKTRKQTPDVKLIDFYRTGIVDAWRDFAQLETSIKFSLLNAENESLDHLIVVERFLGNQKKWDEPLRLADLTRELSMSSELKKVVETVLGIRALAKRTVPYATLDFATYQMALFLYTLNYLSYIKPDWSPSAKAKVGYAVLSASVLGERLSGVH